VNRLELRGRTTSAQQGSGAASSTQELPGCSSRMNCCTQGWEDCNMHLFVLILGSSSAMANPWNTAHKEATPSQIDQYRQTCGSYFYDVNGDGLAHAEATKWLYKTKIYPARDIRCSEHDLRNFEMARACTGPFKNKSAVQRMRGVKRGGLGHMCSKKDDNLDECDVIPGSNGHRYDSCPCQPCSQPWGTVLKDTRTYLGVYSMAGSAIGYIKSRGEHHLMGEFNEYSELWNEWNAVNDEGELQMEVAEYCICRNDGIAHDDCAAMHGIPKMPSGPKFNLDIDYSNYDGDRDEDNEITEADQNLIAKEWDLPFPDDADVVPYLKRKLPIVADTIRKINYVGHSKDVSKTASNCLPINFDNNLKEPITHLCNLERGVKRYIEVEGRSYFCTLARTGPKIAGISISCSEVTIKVPDGITPMSVTKLAINASRASSVHYH
jgi:hypothetical protein